jgi:hypothetical protein
VKSLIKETAVLEHRRSRRKRVQTAIKVFDAITDQAIGHVGNLSADGMLLVSSRELPDDALFQLTFTLPGRAAEQPRRVEIGVHEQWGEPASFPGQYWVGFRIIDIAAEDHKALTAWVETRDEVDA